MLRLDIFVVGIINAAARTIENAITSVFVVWLISFVGGLAEHSLL
jgi:hypothetical protein